MKNTDFHQQHENEHAKAEALASYLGEELDNITESSYDDSTFEVDSAEYMVLTDAEADKRAADYIAQTVFAFNASFLASYTDLPEEVFTALQPRCESANEAIIKLIQRTDEGFEGFVEEAIMADGRGHFMSSYDGEEVEQGDFYIYRTN